MATIPDFEYTARYYWEILKSLETWRDGNVPGISETSPYEPFNQTLRAYALVGHLGAIALDAVARETFLPTARLRQSVTSLLKLIAYPVKSDNPSAALLQVDLTQIFPATQEIVKVYSKFGTLGVGGVDPIIFESLAAVEITRDDQPTHVLAEEAGVFADHTVSFNGAIPFNPWAAAPAPGDMFYFGHPDIIWDTLGLTIGVPAVGLTGVWEAYTSVLDQTEPDSLGVTVIGPTLRFDINDLLGTSDRTGAVVRVKLQATGTYQDLTSQWDGVDNYIVTTNYLGQIIPSTNPGDYLVGANWREVSSLVDNTSDLTATGLVEWKPVEPPVPGEFYPYWEKTTVNSLLARWLRYRIISVAAPASPTIAGGDFTQGTHTLDFPVVQGQTYIRAELAVSTGLPNQRYTAASSPYIQGSAQCWVAGDEWSLAEDFLSSGPQSRHFLADVDDDGNVTYVFGDGTNGKIPTVGDSIEVQYRYDASEDGNVGAYTIASNRGGVPYATNIRNMLAAAGWTPKDGYDEDDLERLKVAGPASLRNLGKAIAAEDVENLSLDWVSAAGSQPIERAKLNEGTYGPKSSQLLVVGTNGDLLSSAVRTELAEWFNGGERLILNQRVVVDNYIPVPVPITATVTGGDQSTIENALQVYLDPLARKADGVSWFWGFGDVLAVAKIIAVIFAADSDVTNVVIAAPAADLPLAADELPVVGALAITIV